MKARYRMKLNGRHVLESNQDFDDAQVEDLDRMFETFGKMMVEELRNNPEWLDQRNAAALDIEVKVPA